MRHFSLFDPRHLSQFVVTPETQSPQSVAFAMDATETDDVFTVRADLPGVSKDAIAIEVVGKVVKITANSARNAATKEGERALRLERHSGEYVRQFRLTQDIEEDAVSAKLENGVLELTLPKKAAVGAKKITIQ